MQRKYCGVMKSRNSLRNALVVCLIGPVSLNTPALANEDGVPTELTSLKLSDGRFVKLSRIGQHSTRVTLESGLGKKRRVLWNRVYEQEHDRLWDQAFFIPVRPGRYIVHLKGSKPPIIAINTFDGGNYLHNYALLFAVGRRSLRFYARSPKPVDLVAPTSAFDH